MSTIHAEVDPLRRDFGLVPDAKKAKIEMALQRFMAIIGQLADSTEAKELRSCGDACLQVCSGCGLSPATEMLPAEFLPTAYGLVWAIVRRKIFACHGNQPEWAGAQNLINTERLRRCGNLLTILVIYGPVVRHLAKRTMCEITTITIREDNVETA